MIERALLEMAPCANPIAPAACFAVDDAAALLIAALLRLDDSRLARLRGVRAASLVVVVGPADDLPWFDGVRYLGEAAPGLFIPTTRALNVPAPLAAAALARHLPAALLDDAAGARSLVPLRTALPLSGAAIRRGLDASSPSSSSSRASGGG